MTDEPVLLSDLDKDNGVLTLTLNRPRRKNAIDMELWIALHDAILEAGHDSDLRALVLTGAGGAFSAGADLAGQRTVHPWQRMRRINETALALYNLSIPTVAKVDGFAVGAGWNLALGCDLVVATPRSEFSQIFAKRGLSLDLGGSWLLPRLVGMQQAKRLALLAEMIDAAEAHRLGLVTWVVEENEIDEYVVDLANRLAAGPPVALAQTKQLLHEGTTRSFGEALDIEARVQAINFATDGPAALKAFVNKTEPEFTGEWQVRPRD